MGSLNRYSNRDLIALDLVALFVLRKWIYSTGKVALGQVCSTATSLPRADIDSHSGIRQSLYLTVLWKN